MAARKCLFHTYAILLQVKFQSLPAWPLLF